MARIIHFGDDSCHRLMVLESVGYAVERCESIKDLEYYISCPQRPDALILSGELRAASRVLAFLASTELPLPVILFSGTDELCSESSFDLVIPALTSPSEWLLRIEKTIERFYEGRTDLSARYVPEHAGHSGFLL